MNFCCPICGMGLKLEDLRRSLCPRCATVLLPCDLGMTLRDFDRLMRSKKWEKSAVA